MMFWAFFFVCPSVCACVPSVFCVLVEGARRVSDPCLFVCSSSCPRLKRGTWRILHCLAVSLTTQCVSGLTSEAEKYDETVKSKWFSLTVDGGVSCLSAQTGV